MPKYQKHTQKPKTTLPNPKPQQDKGTICAPWKPSLASNRRALPRATETPNARAQLCCPGRSPSISGELNSFSNTGPRFAALTHFPSLFLGSCAVLVGSLLPEKHHQQPQHAAGSSAALGLLLVTRSEMAGVKKNGLNYEAVSFWYAC